MRGRLARPSAALRLAAAALCCLALLALRASGHEHEHASPASGSVDAELLPLHGAPGSGMAALSEGAVSLSWELLDNDTVTFAATAHQPSYALGVGLGRGMLNCSAYVAWINAEDGQGYVVSYWIDAKRGDHVLPTGEVLSDVAVVRGSSGALSFRFTRSLRGSGSAGHNASVTLNPASAPFVWGIFPSWTVTGLFDHPLHDDMHTRWSKTPTLLDLSSGRVLSGGGGGSVETALVAHGTLMALAWGLLFPLGSLAARHLKPLGGATFFWAHVGLNSVAFVFVLAGFGVVYSHVGASGAQHFDGGHQKLGVSIFVLAFMQPLNGLLRPAVPKPGEQPSSLRAAWQSGHRWFGRALMTLAAIAVLTGLAELGEDGATHGAVSAGQALWVLWCVLGLGGGAALLEAAKRRREAGRGGAGFAAL